MKKKWRESLQNALGFVRLMLNQLDLELAGSSRTYNDEKSNGGNKLVTLKWRIFEIILAKDTLCSSKACSDADIS